MHVYPLLIGKLDAREDILFRGGDPGKVVPFFSYCHLIVDEDDKILVDTGFGDVEYARTYMDTNLTWNSSMSIETILEERHVSPDDINRIILTHCHWDHVGGLSLFGNATIYCQRDEISWAFQSPDWRGGQYPSAFSKYIVDIRERLILIDGDAVLKDSVSVRKVGGHSPGSQIIFLHSGNREVIITGDAVFYYDNIDKNIPTGSYYDLHESMDTVHLLRYEIRKNPGLIVLPGHDPLVWERYGTKGIELQ
jgi:glyoxylase-like metal-dependent hydrolase (beta-lactamase superfamily II)